MTVGPEKVHVDEEVLSDEVVRGVAVPVVQEVLADEAVHEVREEAPEEDHEETRGGSQGRATIAGEAARATSAWEGDRGDKTGPEAPEPERLLEPKWLRTARYVTA
mmetsp:Transcript_8665/g.6623  ORF Transcript_8665/g.6623 Transcript_8665/m.6623 type:complete len:106 (+) Transcript_8665:45-362(+)